MFKIYENVFHYIIITIIFQLGSVISNFENKTKHLQQVSQIVSNNSSRDDFTFYPARSIDGDLSIPEILNAYTAIENNSTNKFWEIFNDDHRLERGLLQMPVQLDRKVGLADNARSGRVLLIKKKKKKLLKIKTVLLLASLLVKWKKIMFSKFLVLLLVAFKLKFLTVFPIVATGLFLLVGSAGMAGFFLALFAAAVGLKGLVKT